MGFLSDLLDPGRENRAAAARFGRDAQVTGGSAFGPGGISAGFNFGSDGRGTINTGLGSFSPLLSGAQGLAGFGFNLAGSPLSMGFQNIANSALSGLQAPDIGRFGNFGGAAALQQLLGSSLGTATADPFAMGASVTDRLRNSATRTNQNLVHKKFDQLFASGGLSNQVTRNEVTGNLSNLLDEQDLGFQLAGLEAGRGLQSDAVQRVMGSFAGLEGFGGRLFNEGFQEAGLGGQFAMNRFGIGQGLQEASIRQALAGTQIGNAGLGMGMQLSQLPLAFLNANLAAQGLRSDAALGAAGVQTQLASMASSPLLGALEAAGQFGSAIGGFGGVGSLFGGFGGGGSAPTGFGGFGSNVLNVDHLLRGIQ